MAGVDVGEVAPGKAMTRGAPGRSYTNQRPRPLRLGETGLLVKIQSSGARESGTDLELILTNTFLLRMSN